VHERNDHAHRRRASDDKVRHQVCDICQQRFTHASQRRLLTWSCCFPARARLWAAQVCVTLALAFGVDAAPPAADDMAAMKGELEQKDEAYARAHDDLYVVYLPRCLLLASFSHCSRRRRYEAACTLEDDMSAVYRMLSSLAAYDAGATVTAPEYE
jgi:hypothetical protein